MRHTLLQVQTHRGNASRLRANENVVARYGAAISGRGRAAVSDARQPVYEKGAGSCARAFLAYWQYELRDIVVCNDTAFAFERCDTFGV